LPVDILFCRNRILRPLLCFFTFAIAVQNESSAQKPAAAPKVWFGDLPDEPVPAPLKEGAVNCLKAALAGREVKPAYEALASDTIPRILFLSVSDGKSRARVHIACEKGMGPALKKLLAHLPARSAAKGNRWTKLDIVEKATPIQHAAWLFPLPLDHGLDGVAFDRTSRIAFLPQEMLSYKLTTKKGLLRDDRIATQTDRPLPPSLSEIYRFTTTSVFFDKADTIPIYRGHRLFDAVSAEQTLEAAKEAGKYLMRATQKDGRFVYEYDPALDEVTPNYNIVRHAGTVYAMLETYGVTRDEELFRAAKRALEFLLTQIQTKEIEGEEVDLLIEKDAAKLGGNALAIIALAKYIEVSGDRQYIPRMKRLGRWIQKIQDADGRFTVHKLDIAEEKTVEFESRYYPGEAILGMLRLQAITSEATWLDTAERGAAYLIQIRDKGIGEDKIEHDHWLLYALNELHRARPRKEFLEHAMLIARAIIKRQITEPKYPDWLGGFRPPPTSNPAATRTEGLCAVYFLARDHDRPELPALRETIQRAIAFQLQVQNRPETVIHFKDPQRCLGGFAESFTDSTIRIDTVQHNISALLAAAKILQEKGAAPK